MNIERQPITYKEFKDLKEKFETLLQQINPDITTICSRSLGNFEITLQWKVSTRKQFKVSIEALPQNFNEQISVKVYDPYKKTSILDIWYKDIESCWNSRASFLGYVLIPICENYKIV